MSPPISAPPCEAPVSMRGRPGVKYKGELDAQNNPQHTGWLPITRRLPTKRGRDNEVPSSKVKLMKVKLPISNSGLPPGRSPLCLSAPTRGAGPIGIGGLPGCLLSPESCRAEGRGGVPQPSNSVFCS